MGTLSVSRERVGAGQRDIVYLYDTERTLRADTQRGEGEVLGATFIEAQEPAQLSSVSVQEEIIADEVPPNNRIVIGPDAHTPEESVPKNAIDYPLMGAGALLVLIVLTLYIRRGNVSLG
jgi:hypothetical protein